MNEFQVPASKRAWKYEVAAAGVDGQTIHDLQLHSASKIREVQYLLLRVHVQDIEVLLSLLAQNNLHINFDGYPEKPKQDLLSGIRQLHQKHATLRPLLQTTLNEEDFAFVSN